MTRSKRRAARRRLVMLVALGVASFLAASLAGRAGAASSPFTAVDLGTLGGRDSYVVGVNRSGQIVGYSDTTSGDDHAFSWTQAGGMIDLGILAGKNSYAEAVNDAGQVIGNADIGPFAGNTWSWHGFFWTQANGMRDITPISGGQARGMNNAGQVVGLGTGNRPFLWTQSGVMVLLGTGAGFQAGFAEAVNDAGQVVGCIGFPGTRIHAFSWTQAGGMVDLGDLVGGTRESWANCLNRQRRGRRLQPDTLRRPRILLDAGRRDGRPWHPCRPRQQLPRWSK